MSKKLPVILTLGKATQDVFLTSSKEFKTYRHKGVVYEQVPLGAKLNLDNVVFSTGGNATNAAVTFARQGLHSKYVWALGSDPPSQAVIAALDREGVDSSSSVIDEKFRASYSTILLAKNGERTILNFHGTDLPGDGHPLDLAVIEQADWLYLSALNNMPLLSRIIDYAEKHQVKVMMNPSGKEIAEKQKLKALLSDVEVLIMNKEEAAELVSGHTMSELLHHLVHYCPTVIISDGPHGVLATDGHEVVRAGMYEDVPVVDRTGAGDAFGSGFLSQWAQGKSLQESILFASANSTSVVTKIGAKEGILYKNTPLHHMPIDSKPFK